MSCRFRCVRACARVYFVHVSVCVCVCVCVFTPTINRMFMRPLFLRSQLEFSISGEFDQSYLKRKFTSYTLYFKLLFVKS